MAHETAGDPMTGMKWTKKTTQKIADELHSIGICVSAKTVARLLKQMGFSLRVNQKKIESGNKNPPDPRIRDQQFQHIRRLRGRYALEGNPTISVDTKKKELIGNFKNPGRAWEQHATEVKDHDFRSDADGIAVPYGIYDTERNAGAVFLGTTSDTPAFAVDCIEKWWILYGRKQYPQANALLILADSGGSNSPRSRVWKCRLHQKLCKEHKLTVTVCHYPPGSSKWNPIEHRLFSEISKNWSARPLDSFETALKYIRTTKTSSGLNVKARLITKTYAKGEKVSNSQMEQLPLRQHPRLPDWSYTLAPPKM